MTMTADKADAADNTPRAGGMGTEIIANNLPSYNEDDDAQRLEDVAELPFGNDAAEEHHSRSSKQTRSLFNKRTIILGSGIGVILLLCAAAAAAGRKYQSNNNSMVIESLNSAPTTTAKSSKNPTAKSTKATNAPTGICDSTCIPEIWDQKECEVDCPAEVFQACCACRLLQSEPMEEDVPLDRRIELIHDLNGKADASYSFKHNLISTQSCDALIQHIEAAHADDIESGIELPTADSEHAVKEEASETYTAFNGGIENQYNQKLSAGKLASLIGKDETRKLIDYFHESLGDLVINSIVLIRHGLPTDGHYEIGWHTDDCETVEVTLNDDYEGGRLLHLNLDGVHATDTRTGTAIAHSDDVVHGLPTNRGGIRYTLVLKHYPKVDSSIVKLSHEIVDNV